MRLIASLFMALGLSGCGSLVPSTVAWLSGQTPLDADPATISVALVLPGGLRAQENGARLNVIVKRSDTGEELLGAYTLAETPANAADFGAAETASARFYAIKPADVLAMRALQDKVRAWKGPNLAGNRTFSLGIGLDACTTGAGPAPDAVASFYIRNDPAGAFKPLVRGARLTSLLGEAAIAQIKPCSGAK